MKSKINQVINLVKNNPRKYIELSNKDWTIPEELNQRFKKFYGHYHIGESESIPQIYFLSNFKEYSNQKCVITYQYGLEISKILPVYTEYFVYNLTFPDEDAIDVGYLKNGIPAHISTKNLSNDLNKILSKLGYIKLDYDDLVREHVSLHEYFDKKNEYSKKCPNLYDLIFNDYFCILPE